MVARLDVKLPIRCYPSSTEPAACVLGARGYACLPSGERVMLFCLSKAPGVIDVTILLGAKRVSGLQIRVEAGRAAVAVVERARLPDERRGSAEPTTGDELIDRVDVLALAEAILAAFRERAEVAVLALARPQRRHSTPASISAHAIVHQRGRSRSDGADRVATR